MSQRVSNMAYRSTKDKAKAQEYARKLYVKDGLSLQEIRRKTGETIKTLRAWYRLGNWQDSREAAAADDLDRLRHLRDSLLDKAEAQIKEEKLPHTEIGLMYRLERLIAQREKSEEMTITVVTNTLNYLMNYILHYDKELDRSVRPHILEFSKWLLQQNLTRSLRVPRERKGA